MSVAQTRVWNDHTEEHVEEFNGTTIRIPAGKFIVMPYPEAVNFRGQFTPVIRDGLGKDLKPKMIRLEVVPDGQPLFEEKPKHTCMKCVEDFPNEGALEDHVVDKHLDDIADKESKEKLLAKRKNQSGRRTGAGTSAHA